MGIDLWLCLNSPLCQAYSKTGPVPLSRDDETRRECPVETVVIGLHEPPRGVPLTPIGVALPSTRQDARRAVPLAHVRVRLKSDPPRPGTPRGWRRPSGRSGPAAGSSPSRSPDSSARLRSASALYRRPVPRRDSRGSPPSPSLPPTPSFGFPWSRRSL